KKLSKFDDDDEGEDDDVVSKKKLSKFDDEGEDDHVVSKKKLSKFDDEGEDDHVVSKKKLSKFDEDEENNDDNNKSEGGSTKSNLVRKRTTEILDEEEETKRIKTEIKHIDTETERIKAIEEQKQARRQAIKNLFEATGGNIPAMFNEVNRELKDLMKTDKILKLDNISFSDDLKSYRTPTFANSYKLDSATDFFGMQVEDQDLLFDRIGLFKGVVVDYSKENPIEQGYRDVVKHLIRDKDNDDKRSKPVRVFYKKPRLSGFYETNYAFDEYQKKSQESGVFNLGFGLSGSYSTGFNSVAAKAGYGYSKESLSEKSTHIKEISIISSFFLPKIELSFDTLGSCAADDLITYLEQALENEQDTIACFDRVNTILMSYGQFVPTSLIIGARIYSSDTKKLQVNETVENVLTKHAAEFKVAFSSKFLEGGVETKMKSENSSKSHEKSTSESQNITFNAIGGEGAFVADMNKWVASTADSKGWGLVRFDNLVPVIDVLPAELQKRITALFNRVVQECTIEDLLNKSAQFLFHKGYFERFGSKAQPKFCIVKNSLGGKQVLSVRVDGELENNQEVIMSAYDSEGDYIQEWYFANSGKIYLKSNYDTGNKLVLSIDASEQSPKLVITQDNYFDNQFWDARGGMIQNFNGSYITYDGDKIQLETKKEKAKNNTWLLISEKDINTPSRRRIEPTHKNALMLLEGISDTLESNYFLPLDGTLKSHNGYAQLKFSADKIVIFWGKGQKEIWSYTITKSGASKLGITNGRFAILDEKDEVLDEIADDIVDLRLMDSGNLEAIDKENNICWETNSIIYAYIMRDVDKKALSIGVGIEQSKTVYKFINTQTYIGGDYQHWYINRKNNIVSKYTENKQKFALTEVFIDVPNPDYKAKDSSLSDYKALDSITGAFTFGLLKPVEVMDQKLKEASLSGIPPTIKVSKIELAMLNTTNTKNQQWGGLAPNRKGRLQNLVSKNVSEPNDKWGLVFDENAKQEVNMPLVSYSRGPAHEKILKSYLYNEYQAIGLNDINIKGHDIRAVRLFSKWESKDWDYTSKGYPLILQFENSNGAILESSNLEVGRYFSNGFHVPGLEGAAYFSDEDSSLSLKLVNHTNETGNYVGTFQFETDKQKFGVIDMQKVNPYDYEDDTKLNSICGDWVRIPHDHKAIGVAFVKVSESSISPCLISVKR
nr:MAC/perforin domain-containing protein [Spirosomataceae bacterium]